MLKKVYVIDPSKLEAIKTIQEFFSERVNAEGGCVGGISSPFDGKDAEFEVEIENIDFYGEILQRFLDISKLIDHMSIERKAEDLLSVVIRVDDAWIEVEEE